MALTQAIAYASILLGEQVHSLLRQHRHLEASVFAASMGCSFFFHLFETNERHHAMVFFLLSSVLLCGSPWTTPSILYLYPSPPLIYPYTPNLSLSLS